MFKKILIANRGEIAVRIIRACKEMGIKTVAVYSTADKSSMHVSLADEAYCIGPAQSHQSYLKSEVILEVARMTSCEAIHPGYGFLAENASFAEQCQDNGVKFIGPKAEMIRMMGDKSTAKATMIHAGIPVIPGSGGIIKSIEEGKSTAQKVGYPIILKATAGGGGKGMRRVDQANDFEQAWINAEREANAAFGNGGLYLEKFIVDPHHVEIQVLGDQQGNVIHLSERDCSIQRRHQKLIEETPSPAISADVRKKMGDTAIKAAKSIHYEGAGTVEFLVDKNMNFYFMEMNTRVQVEHPITEEATGIDIIKEQIKIAAGQNIERDSCLPVMHAIECRINAENPDNDFMPSPGLIQKLFLPGGKNTRIDTHIYGGYIIPPFYDSLVAKYIATGHTREEAIRVMIRMLNESRISGIHTTIDFHLKVLNHPSFQKGKYNTGFLENIQL